MKNNSFTCFSLQLCWLFLCACLPLASKAQTESWVNYYHAPTVNGIAIDVNGTKWLATDRGVYKYDGTNWANYNSSNSSLVSNDVRSVTIDAQGNKWFANDYYVFKFDGTLWTRYYIGATPIFIAAEQNNLWVCSDYGSVYSINTITFALMEYSQGTSARQVAIDAQGNKWFATNGYGVRKFDGTTWTNYTTSNSTLSNNYLTSVAIDAQGNKWFGMSNGSAARFNGVNWATYPVSGGQWSNNSVNAITIDAQGNKWFGCSVGIAKFDGTNWTNYYRGNGTFAATDVKSITIDAQGNKWFGTPIGVYKFDETSWTNHNPTEA
ncbi:MAG: hypothetical protein RLZZ628_1063, partial [Bacteroidota bacterium]